MDKKPLPKNIVPKIVSVLIAFSVWVYMNSASVKTTQTYKVDVVFSNETDIMKNGLVMDPNTINQIELQVEGNYRDISGVKSSDFLVDIDFSGRALNAGVNNMPAMLVQKPSNNKINIIGEEILFLPITLHAYKEKEVKVLQNINVTPESGYDYTIIKKDIENAKISGADLYVDTVDHVVAEYTENEVNSDIEKRVQLYAVDSDGGIVSYVNIEPKYIDIKIDVKNSKQVPVNVVTKGELGSGIKIKSFKAKPQKVTIYGNEEDLEKIESIDTETIDLSTISKDGTVKVKLKYDSNIYTLKESNEISVEYDIVELLSKEISVPVNVIGKVETNNYSVSSEKVTILVSGSKTEIDSVSEADYTFNVDVTGLGAGIYEYVVEPTLNGEKSVNLSITSKNPEKIIIEIS